MPKKLTCGAPDGLIKTDYYMEKLILKKYCSNDKFKVFIWSLEFKSNFDTVKKERIIKFFNEEAKRKHYCPACYNLLTTEKI